MQLTIFTTQRLTLDTSANYQLSYVWGEDDGSILHPINPPVILNTEVLKVFVYSDPVAAGYGNISGICNLGASSPPSITMSRTKGTFPFSGTSIQATGTEVGTGNSKGYYFPDTNGSPFNSSKFPTAGYYPCVFRITLTVGNTIYSVDPEMVIKSG